jgi:hypothetical protein
MKKSMSMIHNLHSGNHQQKSQQNSQQTPQQHGRLELSASSRNHRQELQEEHQEEPHHEHHQEHQQEPRRGPGRGPYIVYKAGIPAVYTEYRLPTISSNSSNSSSSSTNENPQTRSASLNGTKDEALVTAIEALECWEQMQELSPWFGLVDVAAEFLTCRSRLNDRSGVRNKTMEMGFDRYYNSRDRIFDSTHLRRKMLATALEGLKDYTSSTLSAPPSALQTTIIEIPGPLTRKYNVINSALPRELFAAGKDHERRRVPFC